MATYGNQKDRQAENHQITTSRLGTIKPSTPNRFNNSISTHSNLCDASQIALHPAPNPRVMGMWTCGRDGLPDTTSWPLLKGITLEKLGEWCERWRFRHLQMFVVWHDSVIHWRSSLFRGGPGFASNSAKSEALAPCNTKQGGQGGQTQINTNHNTKEQRTWILRGCFGFLSPHWHALSHGMSPQITKWIEKMTRQPGQPFWTLPA